MGNCLYVEAASMDYFRRPYVNSRKFHGFIVGDDYETYEVMGFSSEAEVPDSIEKVLRHCHNGENDMAFDLFVTHASDDKGVVLDGDYIEAEEVKRILDLLAKEEEMDTEDDG